MFARSHAGKHRATTRSRTSGRPRALLRRLRRLTAGAPRPQVLLARQREAVT